MISSPNAQKGTSFGNLIVFTMDRARKNGRLFACRLNLR